MFKKIVSFPIIILCVLILAGCSEVIIDIPGGTLTINSSENTAPYDALVIFDPDVFVASGNEIIVPINLDLYRTVAANTVFTQFSWSSVGIEIPEGSYYVYSSFDFDRNDELNGGDLNYIYVWAPDISANNLNYYFYDSGATEIATTNGVLVPNYHVLDNFCAELDFYMEIAF